MKFRYTDRYPNGYMSPATKIADENDGNDVSDLVGAGNDARKAGWDFEPFLYGRDHRIYVTWTKCLLQRDEKWEEEHEHLKSWKHVNIIIGMCWMSLGEWQLHVYQGSSLWLLFPDSMQFVITNIGLPVLPYAWRRLKI